jgi:CBS domain-containing protein
MLVAELMKNPPATCTTNDRVTDAAKIMHEHRCGFVPVVGVRGAVVGVVTDRDVCLTAGDKNRAMTHVSVQDAMSHPVFSCYADDNVNTALATMASATSGACRSWTSRDACKASCRSTMSFRRRPGGARRRRRRSSSL